MKPQSPQANDTHRAKPSRLPLVITIAVMALYAVTFSTMGILQYHAGNVWYIDTATGEEQLWRTLHGQFLRTTEYDQCCLGQHVMLIHLLLLPIYAILPNLQTLMVAQTVALALGALPIYALAGSVLRKRWLGCAFAVAYLLYTPMQMINLEGGTFNTFRAITLAVPLLLAAFYFAAHGRLVAFSICAGLVLLCQEDYALEVAALGFYVAGVFKRRAFGLVWAAVGLLWFALALGVVIPHFSGGTSHTVSYYSHLGSSAGEVFWSVFTNPLRALQIAFAPQKLEFLLILFLPVGFLCLLSPLTLAMALPAFGVCLLSQRYATWMPWFHYHTPIIPFVFIAAIYGVRNLLRFATQSQAGPAAARRLLTTSGAWLLLCALLTNVIYSKSPLSFRFYDEKSGSCYKHLYVVTPHARRIPEVVRSVPRDKRVSASLFLNTRFTHHAASYVFPRGLDGGHLGPADYVVVDLQERWFDEQRSTLERLRRSPEFREREAPDGFVILERAPREAPP
jgi:uncharacterized membrane protein